MKHSINDIKKYIIDPIKDFLKLLDFSHDDINEEFFKFNFPSFMYFNPNSDE